MATAATLILLLWALLNPEPARRLAPSSYFHNQMRFLLPFLTIAAFAAAPAHAARCGDASWYGPGFEGNLTANGERFSSNRLTAASRSLPFGSRVMVTNQSNGRSVVVRINDYGPALPDRIIDLSRSAFASIASPSQGIARVCWTRLA